MNKILLLILCFAMTGCAEWKQFSDYSYRMYDIGNNIKNAVENKENLVGLTAQQIADKFGTTDDVSTSYNSGGRLDIARYTYTQPYFPNNVYSFRLTVVNNVVTSVDYE